MNRQIIVLGSVNADHVLRVDQFPRPGETITGSSYQIVSGGKGANQAVACARLGGTTQFIACIGQDAFGNEVIRQLTNDGINTDSVEQTAGVNTGVALIFVDNHGENCIGISAEANHYLDEACVTRHQQAIADADYLLMQLETPEAGIIAAASIAGEYGTTVILNPAPARALSDNLLACIDIITPNQTEAEALTSVEVNDRESAARAAKILHSKGINTVVITMGGRGAYISQVQSGNITGEMIAGFQVQPIDTTAAGDTFNGGFLVALAEGKTVLEAARFANCCGALSVMRRGAQTSIPVRAEVEAFSHRHDEVPEKWAEEAEISDRMESL